MQIQVNDQSITLSTPEISLLRYRHGDDTDADLIRRMEWVVREVVKSSISVWIETEGILDINASGDYESVIGSIATRYPASYWIDKGALKPPEILNDAKKIKVLELEKTYTSAQLIQLHAGYTFAVPLKGDFFNVLLTNQVLAAQVVGYASLILQDTEGQMRVLQDVPFDKWKYFYTIAKDISFSNLILKNQKQVEIMSAQSEEQLAAISLDIFPAIQEVIIDI